MLVRIVRMHFREEEVETFKEIFYDTRPHILKFRGCASVELYVDAGNPSVLYTHSTWDDEKFLDEYRASAFFKQTWQKVKRLFESSARAYSLKKP